ncbi:MULTISPECIES: three-Cys-motif partner protein TcmP [Janthinobacterium]|uniref:Three-Cys-motif partner protein TcmP n=1 Tax=Janthinobacterium violaceinigrum TaxID=2654252 RepID=A0A6I1HX76_9BURK|nr:MULTISPECIES: three-Cys-motif partner protein TcmP [Janthinobacterium]KAB8063215.1 three-Cys-motif partner protein TcmP [Janthinobacterium violaceinigrum]MED5617158.1 three-Cys-motif partner protein TcmP [Janthinobacterium sp. P210005]
MKFNPHEIIPKAYVGREQAYIKHLLLEGYLERLLYIVGWSATQLGHEEIVFVDCFAGPWKDDSDDLKSTSIAISMELLSKVQYTLKKAGRPVKFRALYVEKNVRAFSRLNSYLSSHTPPNVVSGAINGDFTQCVPEILAHCPAKSFVFFFIDPKGWAAVKPEILQPLLARPRSEFLINFMYDFVNRAASMSALQENIAALLGGAFDMEEVPANPAHREQFLLGRYRDTLVTRASQGNARALSGFVSILDPTADRTKYHLLYLTRHPKGIIEFMTQSERLAGVQDAVRTAAKFNKKNREDSTGDLFGIDASQVESSIEDDGDRLEKLSLLWLERIGNQPLIVTEAVFAELICKSNCFPFELQLALKNLMIQGKVSNVDGNIKRRIKNAVNYDKKETLILTTQKQGD